MLRYLISERDVGPEYDDILLQVVVDSVRALAGDGDALPLLGPVLDPVERDDGLALQDVVEHGRGVLVVGLALAGGQLDEAGPGVAEVAAVAPGQLVLVLPHLQPQVVPAQPLPARVPCVSPLLNNYSAILMSNILCAFCTYHRRAPPPSS